MENFTIGESSANILSIMMDFHRVYERAVRTASSLYGDNSDEVTPILDAFNAANDTLFDMLKGNIIDSIGRLRHGDTIAI